MKIRRANRGSLRALCLLSSRCSASRCRRNRVAALVRQPGAFLRMCLLFFRREISERPSALDRQRRTPTKGRIQNTPERENRAQSRNGGENVGNTGGLCKSPRGPAYAHPTAITELQAGKGAVARDQHRLRLALRSGKNGVAISGNRAFLCDRHIAAQVALA